MLRCWRNPSGSVRSTANILRAHRPSFRGGQSAKNKILPAQTRAPECRTPYISAGHALPMPAPGLPPNLRLHSASPHHTSSRSTPIHPPPHVPPLQRRTTTRNPFWPPALVQHADQVRVKSIDSANDKGLSMVPVISFVISRAVADVEGH